MIPLHVRRTHPTPVDGCFGCKAATVKFNDAGALAAMNAKEKTLTDDLREYKALRQQGYQPEHLRGSAELARKARNRHEIEHASLMKLPDDARAHVEEAAQVATEIPQAITREALASA